MKYGEKAIAEARLELWDNTFPEKEYTVEITFPEFTCLCPRSGYPDFATIRITYVPDKYIVELRSLKLYLNTYRDKYITHEEAVNRIYADLKEVLAPRSIEVVGDFHVRGGIKTVVRVSSEKTTR